MLHSESEILGTNTISHLIRLREPDPVKGSYDLGMKLQRTDQYYVSYAENN